MADLWEDKGYRFLGLKSQNLQDQASRLEKMEQEQNYTQNTSTFFESGNRLEIELDDIEEKAPKENNIQADLRNIQNNSPQQQFENTISINSEIEQLSEIAESASHSAHCLHKRVQVKVHLLHAYYRFLWGSCWSNPKGNWQPTSPNFGN